ncbi:unnamed protein product [Caenorhabditis sp. 36 PRJEB53466]|nr:unnamed protein product [Caenorhabditis sp. 36 PRJEB53466]
MSQDYGKATYVTGRHRKNRVLIYTSRTDRTKVYEFMQAAKFKIPGMVSWKCVSCSKVKNGYRNLGAELKRKVPLILVDNDIIKEDPEKPLNAEHFCNGKEAVQAVLSRAKLEFVARHGDDEIHGDRMRETIQDFAREAVSSTPVPLSIKEKRQIQKSLDAGCLDLIQGVSKRRKTLQRKRESNMIAEESIEEINRQDSGEGISGVGEMGKQRAEDHGDAISQKRMRLSQPETIPLTVRPLPPYYYTHVTPPDVQVVHHHPHHHHLDDQNSIDYYEEMGEGHQFIDGELIPADQQDVAYDIELR